MDLITDETSGLTNAGWTGSESFASSLQKKLQKSSVVSRVFERGFFVLTEHINAQRI
jgi:hypothetical protein